MGLQLGLWVSQRRLVLKCLKCFPWFSIGLQQCTYQVSSHASQVCSVNGSNDWKSTVLDKKSTTANIQSNFNIFGQNQHFEVIFIIWLGVDHDSPRNNLKSSKVKNCQIRVSLGKVNWTLTKHNFHMLHQLFPNQSPFWKILHSLQLFTSML